MSQLLSPALTTCSWTSIDDRWGATVGQQLRWEACVDPRVNTSFPSCAVSCTLVSRLRVKPAGPISVGLGVNLTF